MKPKNIKVKGILFSSSTHEVKTGKFGWETIQEYSANITINCETGDFVLQVSGNQDETHRPQIPESHINLCGPVGQDYARKNYDADLVWNELEKQGYENNLPFLEQKGSQLFNKHIKGRR